MHPKSKHPTLLLLRPPLGFAVLVQAGHPRVAALEHHVDAVALLAGSAHAADGLLDALGDKIAGPGLAVLALGGSQVGLEGALVAVALLLDFVGVAVQLVAGGFGQVLQLEGLPDARVGGDRLAQRLLGGAVHVAFGGPQVAHALLVAGHGSAAGLGLVLEGLGLEGAGDQLGVLNLLLALLVLGLLGLLLVHQQVHVGDLAVFGHLHVQLLLFDERRSLLQQALAVLRGHGLAGLQDGGVVGAAVLVVGLFQLLAVQPVAVERVVLLLHPAGFLGGDDPVPVFVPVPDLASALGGLVLELAQSLVEPLRTDEIGTAPPLGGLLLPLALLPPGGQLVIAGEVGMLAIVCG